MGRIEKTVFISYRRTNFPWAYCIYQDLTHHGFDAFFDYQSIDSGNFEKVILENIKARAHFIVVLAPSALERCIEPGDWFRREIETAIDERRNIIPIMLESFDFGSPLVQKTLTGKLASLSSYNGMSLVAEYMEAGLEKLRNRFLNVALEDVHLHTLTKSTKEITESQKAVANIAPPVRMEEIAAQTLYEKGYVAQEASHIDRAIAFYTQAIETLPSFFQAYNNRGVLYRVKGDLDNALRDFNKIIHVEPAAAEAYTNRGTVYIDKKEPDKAIADFSTAILIKPDLADAYANRGTVHRSKGDFTSAIEDFNKAISLEPNNASFYYDRGNTLRNAGNLDRAIADYNAAIKRNPNLLDAYGNRGLSYQDKGNLDKAIADYNKVILRNPNDEKAFYNRGSVQSEKGKLDEAIRDYDKAIHLKPDFSEAYYSRGLSFQLRGDFEKAVQDFQEAIRLKPDYGLARSSLINVLRKMGRNSDADQQVDLARELIAKENQYNQACFEAICGSREKALELLKIGLEKRQSTKEWARLDPDFETIRDDPRFKELVGE